MAKLADAPDLGLRNHRFQSIASRFTATRVYEGKTPILAKSRYATNGEQKGDRSSTNPSTQMHQTLLEIGADVTLENAYHLLLAKCAAVQIRRSNLTEVGYSQMPMFDSAVVNRLTIPASTGCESSNPWIERRSPCNAVSAS